MDRFEQVRLLEFPQLGDDRGELIVVEGERDIPFPIKRVFYIRGTQKGVVRGRHANKRTEFVLINVAGNSRIRIDDGRGHKRVVVLDRPNVGVYLPSLLWKEMYDFSDDSVLLVLASEHYDSKEYLRDFDEYIEYLKSEEID